ncbi:MAG: hypothetical protein C5B55_07305 [Blastocatellia bacterium]|nr:MAG: hypothetical protein C5B55_07305 [Blastocatellia bacterium]
MMTSELMIVPLSLQHNIYALRDERGNTLGTGTREVCEVLLYIVTRVKQQESLRTREVRLPARENVRAAIPI